MAGMMMVSRKFVLALLAAGLVFILAGTAILYLGTRNRVVIQFDIHQNQEAIYLSTYAEPPQFAIWIEDPETGECQTVFVTSRVGNDDWEGKRHVPVALPRWYALFRGNGPASNTHVAEDSDLTVTGATPKENYFSVRAEVPPGSAWICWIEMNLSGDYNEAFPEFNRATLFEDEYACGQPALLYRAEVIAEEGFRTAPQLAFQSVYRDGENYVEPVSEGVTTARNVFDDMQITVLQPKVKIIEDKVEELSFCPLNPVQQ